MWNRDATWRIRAEKEYRKSICERNENSLLKDKYISELHVKGNFRDWGNPKREGTEFLHSKTSAKDIQRLREQIRAMEGWDQFPQKKKLNRIFNHKLKLL